jgi:hypothetical protein
VLEEADKPLVFLTAEDEEYPGEMPFVVIVRSQEHLNRWLCASSPFLQWIQVERLLGEKDVWAEAAQLPGNIPLDIILTEPGREFSDLYRLADVVAVRDVRISMPPAPGFFKAVRLGASLGLPIRLLPLQPSPEMLRELSETLDFYLHDPMVEAPIEFFHSTLAWMRGARVESLWRIFEDDPDVFVSLRANQLRGRPNAEDFPRGFVSGWLKKLLHDGAECADCPWQTLCQGHFKWPDPAYSCDGVKRLFATLRSAADDIEQDLSAFEAQTQLPGSQIP